MKKRSFLTLFLALALSLAAGCGKGSAPEKAVEAYCTALQNSDFKAMAKVSVEDYKSGVDFFQDMSQPIASYFRNNLKLAEFSVGKAKIESDKATVAVKFKYKDAENVFRALLQEFNNRQDQIFSEFDKSVRIDSWLHDYFTKIFEEQKEKVAPLDKEITVIFHCVKDQGSWKVSEAEDEIYMVMFSGFTKVEDEIYAIFDLDSLMEKWG
ncbi:MAG: DUF4878 domain-containing protein [Clostridiales bacterium]|nr:DUF4878 domain-containing protein [Clostridiales bacterium]